jgi:hypothetical protein
MNASSESGLWAMLISRVAAAVRVVKVILRVRLPEGPRLCD